MESKITIYLAQKIQISLLITKQVTIPHKYFKFANVFSKLKTLELLKITNLN